MQPLSATTIARRSSNSSGAHLARVAAALSSEYQDFRHHNRRDPLEELIFIILSARTNEGNYRRTFAAFRRAFPTRSALAAAKEEEIALAIRGGGLASKKAAAIRKIIDRCVVAFGRPTLAPLRSMSADAAEAFLTDLPGVGTKIARCVLMYSLDREVFPIDVHCLRVLGRLGHAPRTTRLTSSAHHDAIQLPIPAHLRLSLHVNLISHGRKICRPKPLCADCMLADICPKLDVRHDGPS